MNRSDISLAAWLALEDKLSDHARQLMEAHEKLLDDWRKAGWPTPTSAELTAAIQAVEADPLASIVFGLWRKTITEAAKYRAAMRTRKQRNTSHDVA